MKFFLKISVISFMLSSALWAMDDTIFDTEDITQAKVDFAEPKQEESDVETTGPLKVEPIRSLSIDHVMQAQAAITKEETVRSRVQKVAIAGIIAAASYVVWSTGKSVYGWWNPKKEKTPEERVNKLSAKVKKQGKQIVELEKNRKEIKKAEEQAQGWGGYFWGKMKGCGGWLNRRLTSEGATFVYGIGLWQVGNMLQARIPDLQTYVFADHTIAWYITKKTKLIRAIRDLAHWADEFENIQETDPVVLGSLCALMNIYVGEIEKVLGLMAYVTEEIAKEEASEERADAYARADQVMTLLSKLLTKAIAECNEFVKNGAQDKQKQASFALDLKALINLMITQMESFETVQEAAGIKNTERLMLFDNVRMLLDPRVKRLRLELNAYKERIGEGLQELEETLDVLRAVASKQMQA